MVQLVLQNCCKGSRLKSFVSHFTTQNNMICSLLFRHSCNWWVLKIQLVTFASFNIAVFLFIAGTNGSAYCAPALIPFAAVMNFITKI